MVMRISLETADMLAERERRSGSRPAPRRRRRRDHPAPVPGGRSAHRPQTGPHPGHRRRPRRRGRAARADRRRAPGRRGGRRGARRQLRRRRAGLGAGSHRRHQELLPRLRRVGFADRADRARRAGGRGGQRAGAGPALVGGAAGPAPGPATGPGRTPRRIEVSGIGELADAYLSTTDFRLFERQGHGAPVPGAGRGLLGDPRVRRLLAVLPGRRGGAATWPWTRSPTRGTWPRCCPSSPRPAAPSPTWPARPASTAATGWPATAGCTPRRWRSSGRTR